MSTNINNLADLTNQGETVVSLAGDFSRTIEEIYDLYNNLSTKWTGQKAEEYKRKIEELHEPLNIIIGTIKKQGSAVQAAGEALQRFERS